KKVQGVRCTLLPSPFGTLARIALDPVANVPFQPLKAEVAKVLELYRCAGHCLHVEQATPVPLEIAMAVLLEKGVSKTSVARELQTRFGTGTLPNGQLAFFHPDRYTFGDKIYKSRVIAEAIEVPGVRSVTFGKFGRSDQHGADREFIAFFGNELPKLTFE